MQQIIAKRIIREEDLDNYRLLYKGKNGEVRKLSKEEVLKIISDIILEISFNISPYSRSIIERNVLYSHKYSYPEEFYLPTSAVYTEKGFIGYTQEYFNGVDIIDYYRDLLRAKGTYTFNGILEPYKKLNEALKDATHTVCPDLASGGNILVDYYDNIAITDFAGLQIGGRPSTDISCFIISSHAGIQDQVQEDMECTKYMKRDLFTKELDKRTLLVMMLRDVLNLDIPSLELSERVFPFELKKRALLKLKLRTQILSAYFSKGYDKDEKEAIAKKNKKELQILGRQSNRTDYDSFKRVLNMTGIEDNTYLMNAILRMSSDSIENAWLDNIIDELESNYILENEGRVRRLIKKI